MKGVFMADATVILEEVHPRLLKMVWQTRANSIDVRNTFEQICDYLGNTEDSVWIIVDITANPNMSLTSTVFPAMNAQKMANLEAWLVLGRNKTAEVIGRTLSSITGKKNIQWFETEAELKQYLAALNIDQTG